MNDATGMCESDVLSAIAGDRDATRRLWQDHRRWVAAVLLAHKPAWADLDDLLQDVAVRLVSKVSELREPVTFRAWLRTIAVNVARAAGRQSARRGEMGPLEEDRLPVDDAGPFPDQASIEQHDAARNLLARAMGLPESYREPLLLRAVRGMRPPEIARALGLPETTVHTRIARARRMLRAEYESQAPNGGVSGGSGCGSGANNNGRAGRAGDVMDHRGVS